MKFVSLLLLMTLVSCAISPSFHKNNLVESREQEIKKGLTLDQVKELLGSPYKKFNVKDVVVWQYTKDYEEDGKILCSDFAIGFKQERSNYVVKDSKFHTIDAQQRCNRLAEEVRIAKNKRNRALSSAFAGLAATGAAIQATPQNSYTPYRAPANQKKRFKCTTKKIWNNQLKTDCKEVGSFGY